jgi:hypothetical protein
MRIRVAFAVAALALFAAPAAVASTLPDLPGMGTAQKATANQTIATPSAAKTSTVTTNATPVVQKASAAAGSTADLAKPIRSLPGGNLIPAIGGSVKTSSRSALPGPDGLVVFAAIGSFAALGALYLLRRLGRI